MKQGSQFRPPPSTHINLFSRRGRYTIEAKKDPKTGEFVVSVNARIVDRQKKAGSAILSWKFWVVNCAGYKCIYYVKPKKGR